MIIKVPVITIDGPCASGKGTLCKAMSQILKWNILDSGAIYRVLALAAIHHQVDISSEEALIPIAMHLDVDFITKSKKMHVFLEGEDVSTQIFTQKVVDIASKIATFSSVRNALLHRQRSFCKSPGLIADGRDMGTIVFPEAPVKIFLHATSKERAQRRTLQLQNKGFPVIFKEILYEIENRDQRDYNRSIAPLVPAKDALMLDSTNMSIEKVIKTTLKYVRHKLLMVYL